MLTADAVLILMTFRSEFCSQNQANKSPEICASIEPQKHIIRKLIKDNKQE